MPSLTIRRLFFVACLSPALSGVLGVNASSAATFSDVPSNSPLYESIEFLTREGILSGFSDGTFRPEQKVNRAEAIKVIVASKDMKVSSLPASHSQVYSDISSDAWYAPYVELARKELLIIDGPPKASAFHPERPVKKSEFFKMLFLAHGFDPAMFSEIKLPLSSDVTDTQSWDYPYIRLAIATSTLLVNAKGVLTPQKELTRGDVALLLERFLHYREGKRTQELLSQIEQELLLVTKSLNAKDYSAAERASARALLEARGAKETAKDEKLVTAVVRITEAYRALVRATRAILDKKPDDAVKLSKDAWFIASQAMELNENVRTFALEVQECSQQIAGDARKLK